MNAGALQSVPLRGGISALFCVLILGLLTFTGCSGTNGPIGTDALNGIFRSGMAFGSGNYGDTGFSLDSASTIWVYPTPNDQIPGDIALSDTISTTTIEPLVTAFVTHNNEFPSTTCPADIALIMLDGEEDVVYSDDDIYASTGATNIFCRHPVVEVTYERWEEAETGYVRVHIVWSQLNETNNVEHWDLYYRYLVWEATSSGITWGSPYINSTVHLEDICTVYDELEPDIGTFAGGNDIFLVYLFHDPALSNPENDLIMGAVHLDDDFDDPYEWGTAYQISDDNSNAKGAPRTDAGYLQVTEGGGTPIDTFSAVVWNECVPDDLWQIFYAKGHVTSSPGSPQQISGPGENDEINFLPQIDITPEGETIKQAIVTWTMACLDESIPPETEYHFVMITATPFLEDSVRPVARYSRCSDVATYQVPIPEPPLPPPLYGRFGVSYYQTLDESGDWETEVAGYTFVVDWQSEIVWFSDPDFVHVDTSPCQWNQDNPFSGPTLCLRWPYDPELLSLFGLAWIVDDVTPYDIWDAYWEIGTIQE